MIASLALVLSAYLSPPFCVGRRALVFGAGAASLVVPTPLAALAADYAELQTRLDTPLVAQASMAPALGKVEPRMPGWLSGRWQCEQTLRRYSTPQGVQYIGAAGRPVSRLQRELAASLEAGLARVGSRNGVSVAGVASRCVII